MSRSHLSFEARPVIRHFADPKQAIRGMVRWRNVLPETGREQNALLKITAASPKNGNIKFEFCRDIKQLSG